MKPYDLIGDIGGTNVRFAMLQDGEILNEQVLKCADHAGLAPAARAYIKNISPSQIPDSAAFAIAGPVLGDRFQMTNHPWSFSISDVRDKLGLKDLRLFNDFHALAMAIPHLAQDDLARIGEGKPQPGKPKAIVGPGTGLGVACLFWDGEHYRPVPGEGGHVTMPAKNQREYDVFEWLRGEKYSHVSAERVCSGKGLVNVYNALRALDKRDDLPDLEPEGISKAAREKDNACAVEAWEMLTGFLGTIAGNLALTLGAHGGVYIAGGIMPQSGDLLCHTRFREQFEAKGRFEEYLSVIPTFLITHPFPAFAGLKAYLSGQQPA